MSEFRKFFQKTNPKVMTFFRMELDTVDIICRHRTTKAQPILRLCDNMRGILAFEIKGVQEIIANVILEIVK